MANTFNRKLSRNITNTLTQVGGGAVPASTKWTVIGLVISNTFSTAIQVSATVNDATNDFYLVKDADVPVGGTLVVVGGEQKLVLNTGDSVKVKTNNASHTCDAIMSILEIV